LSQSTLSWCRVRESPPLKAHKVLLKDREPLEEMRPSPPAPRLGATRPCLHALLHERRVVVAAERRSPSKRLISLIRGAETTKTTKLRPSVPSPPSPCTRVHVHRRRSGAGSPQAPRTEGRAWQRPLSVSSSATGELKLLRPHGAATRRTFAGRSSSSSAVAPAAQSPLCGVRATPRPFAWPASTAAVAAAPPRTSLPSPYHVARSPAARRRGSERAPPKSAEYGASAPL